MEEVGRLEGLFTDIFQDAHYVLMPATLISPSLLPQL